MKWKVKVEWLNHEVVSMSIVESEDGSDTKMKAIDDFAVDWLNCAGLWKPQTDPREEWFEQAKAKGELFYKELPNRKYHWEQKEDEKERLKLYSEMTESQKDYYYSDKVSPEWRRDIGLPTERPTKQEAEQKKEAEQKGKKYGDNFLPPEGYTNGKERKIMERLEALEEAVHKPYIPFSVREAKDIVYKYQAKVEALENRLTEIEGVLSSIGSPDYDLRKKVEALEIQAKHFACYIPDVSYELKNE